MRSSVSVILSDPAPDYTMAFPDYKQTCSDHARLLVLIARIGHQMSEQTFQQVSSLIKQVHEVPVVNKDGLTRNIGVRYTHHYPLENNEWGEFQAHRRILGVVSVGSCSSQVELNELCRLHETVKNKFINTLFDSRCIVLCDSENGIDEEKTLHIQEDVDTDGGGEVDKPPSWFQPQNHKTRLLQFHGAKYSAALTADLKDFIASLFWILESKRVEWSRETGERSTLLCAPFERKDFVGLDMESRNNRKRVLGRQKKHLGDLSLLAGLPAEAWNYYQVGCDVLRPANDWLWLAGCLEGLCAVSMLLQERHEKGVSFGAVGLSWEEVIEKYRECVNHYAKYKYAGIIETEASLKAVVILVKHRSYLLASEFLQNIVFINLQLSDREKIERFIALSNLYSQIGFRRKASFFQRVAAMRCVAPQNPSHDWASCYSLMLESVKGYNLDLGSCSQPETGWPTLQVQLLQELVGTSRKMGAHAASTRHMTFLFQCMYPWLSQTERQDFATQLSVLSQRAVSTPAPLALETSLFKGALYPMSGKRVLLPPVNIICLPKVSSVQASPLPGNLAPVSAPSLPKVQSGPFLFTPIMNLGGGGSARSSGRSKLRSVTWVQNDTAEVSLQVQNTLGVEVKISNLSLTCDGIDFEVIPSHVMLESHLNPQTVIIRGVPKSEGVLRILGYSHSVLGVTSFCDLKDIPGIEEECIKVQVVSPLPVIDIHCEELVYSEPELQEEEEEEELDLVDGQSWKKIESLNLFSGETQTLRLVIRNTGSVPALGLDLRWVGEEGEPPDLELDKTLIKDNLPLKPGDFFTIPLILKGINNQNFRADDCLSTTGSDSRWSASGFNSLQSKLSHPQSLPSHLPVPPSIHPGSGNPSLLSQLSESEQPRSLLRFKVEVKGSETEWCRRSEYVLIVYQVPSISVSRWDVLPGERAENCFLVLDLVNRAGEEIELTYTVRKQLQIEAGDVCRVPVPVEKCSFSDSLDWLEGGEEVNRYMEERVHLLWSLGEGRSRRTGQASLSGVMWTECMLEMLRRPPLAASVLINGVECVEGRDTEVRVGKMVEVEVELVNSLLEPVEDCRLLVRLEQDSTGSAGVGCSGGSGLHLPGELGAGRTCSHSSSLLPLSPGHYSLLVSVSLVFRTRIHSWRLPNLTLNAVL